MQNKLTMELAVCGFNAVAALGELHPETINRLFLRQDRFLLFTTVCKNLADRKRPYKVCDDEELERICKSNRHQGTVAMIEMPEVPPLSREELDAWAREGKTGLFLYSVGNDHNLGAIVRSAAFFGVDYVIISDTDEAAQLTTSAYRVAEGGMEHVLFRKVQNAPAFLKSALRVTAVIGADHRARRRLRDLGVLIREKAESLAKKGLPETDGRPGILLVLGNEETGLPPDIKEHCSALVRIPGTGNIESLNVAQAATLFLHELYEL
jgi:TrmH RNA methyltransferase